MWGQLVSWAQRQVWPESPETFAIPPLPFLPPPQPSSCNADAAAARGDDDDDDDDDDATTAPAPHNGVFFERLSADLRRMVLVEAFGGRVVHVDLRYDRPLRARPPRKVMHAGGVDVLDQGHSASRQMRQPRAWQWYSCVCHRDPAWAAGGRGRAGVGGAEEAGGHPATDSCLRRGTQSCDGPPGDTGDMSRCFLGVMGWLMTCRQAYIEGVDILYPTNRFHISGMPLIQHLPRLIPARALSDIQSVEMCWDLGQVVQPPAAGQDDVSAHPQFHGWRTFQSLLRQLPGSLPRLGYLHLTLRGIWFPPQMAVNDVVRHSEPAMLRPVDGMVRELYRTSGRSTPRYIVAVPANVFRARMTLESPALHDGPGAVLGPAATRRLVWRSLGPGGPGQLEAGAGGGMGYWLENALDDEPLPRGQASLVGADRVPLPSIALAGDW